MPHQFCRVQTSAGVIIEAVESFTSSALTTSLSSKHDAESVRFLMKHAGCIQSCGILCYSIPPNTDEPFFLLGQDYYSRDHYWSHFSGRLEDGESPEHAAAREALEETRGVIKFSNDDFPSPEAANWKQRIEFVAKLLKEKTYTFKITTCINYGDVVRQLKQTPNETSASTCARLNITYVLKVPWQPLATLDFAEQFDKLCFIDNKIQAINRLERLLWPGGNTCHCRPGFDSSDGQEKTKNKLTCFFKYGDTMPTQLPFVDDFPQFTCEKISVCSSTTNIDDDILSQSQITYEFAPAVAQTEKLIFGAPALGERYDEGWKKMLNECAKSISTDSCNFESILETEYGGYALTSSNETDNVYFGLFTQWLNLKNQLWHAWNDEKSQKIRALEGFQSDVTTHSVCLRTCMIEKMKLGYWKSDYIHDAIKQVSVTNNSIFCPNQKCMLKSTFVPIIALALMKFEKCVRTGKEGGNARKICGVI